MTIPFAVQDGRRVGPLATLNRPVKPGSHREANGTGEAIGAGEAIGIGETIGVGEAVAWVRPVAWVGPVVRGGDAVAAPVALHRAGPP